jgi:hypothetical protein
MVHAGFWRGDRKGRCFLPIHGLMGGVQCTLWLIGVGDSVWDIEVAEEAGVRTVTVTADGASSRAELEEVGVYSVHKHS